MEKLTEWIWGLVKLACYIFWRPTFYLSQVISVSVCMWYQFIIGRKFEIGLHHLIEIYISSWKFMKDFETCSYTMYVANVTTCRCYKNIVALACSLTRFRSRVGLIYKVLCDHNFALLVACFSLLCFLLHSIFVSHDQSKSIVRATYFAAICG